jgi:uncharacterized protein (DUF2062 family)
MPRRFFRKFAFKRHELTEQRFIAPFRHLLHDQHLWGIRRKTVVPAVAWGVFVAFLPVPGHVVVAVLGALVLRCNIPVAALATFVSNPLTIGPMFYFSYRVGAKLLGVQPVPFSIELSFNWLQTTFASIWQPLLLGSILVGSVCSLIAYVLLDVFWRFSISDYKSRKRSDRHRRSGNS